MSDRPLRTLIIDNYDSFTFNLFQLVAMVNGEEPTVVRNDQVPWAMLAALPFDNLIVSPGPGHPKNPLDFGICSEAIAQAQIPLLGVCLGHQGMGLYHGGKVVHAKAVMHGRQSAVFHDESELLAGIPQGFLAVRYHSLVVAPELPWCLRKTAWTADGVVMGMAHRSLPQWGVQFHPESICTEYGERLIQNFAQLTRQRKDADKTRAQSTAKTHSFSTLSVVPAARAEEVQPLPLQVYSRKLPLPAASAEELFCALFQAEPLAFWLDSSRAEHGLSRFSYLGKGGGPHSALVTYNRKLQQVTVTESGQTRCFQEDLLSFLKRELDRRYCRADWLPFDFSCGFVGYLGYELGSGAEADSQADHPDASFLLADQLLVLDHQESQAFLVCLAPKGDSATAEAWFAQMERQLAAPLPTSKQEQSLAPFTLRLLRSRAQYLQDIARCQQLLSDGESYEICLTNQIQTGPIADPLSLYRALRTTNPAPYAAFLKLPGVSVLCSSPERFLRVERDGSVESKPIKGTRPRGETEAQDLQLIDDLRSSEKDRSENLMIVDLLRNDLGQVCKVGSVHVPKLMQVESYHTVHQLVSTVRGQLKAGLTATDCIRAAFPGGSMTGAPKQRTMRIIEQLESAPRGIYSGAIGFLALNGTADLNIVIRTLVATPKGTTLGIGGAVVALSDPEAEFAETLVKARALIDALLLFRHGRLDPAQRQHILTQLAEEGVAQL